MYHVYQKKYKYLLLTNTPLSGIIGITSLDRRRIGSPGVPEQSPASILAQTMPDSNAATATHERQLNF
jgi:hypothetical protein